MLSRQLLLRQQLTRITRAIKNSRCSSSKLSIDPELTGTGELRLSAHQPKKPKREPFAKNMFVGKFDVELLAYPEPQTHERHGEFFEWLKPIEDYINEEVDAREIDRTGKIPKKIFDDFITLGVMRAAVDEAYGGLGLNNSEYAKLVETVSAVPILGTFLVKRANIVKIISDYASEEQKSRILPKIASGETRPALCFSESPTGTIAELLESKAVLNDDLTHFQLTGHKTFVIDASSADLFVVIALQSASDAYVKQESLAAFLVPSGSSGIVVSKPMPMLGQRGLDVCSVTFNDVTVPKENKLDTGDSDSQLFISVLAYGKHNTGGQAIGILKRYLDLLTSNAILSKNFNVKRIANDSMHEPIGRVACELYAMEAMTYFTTGLIDTYEDQDCNLEKSLVESFCTEGCIQMILHGAQLTGGSAYCKDDDFERLLRDALALRAYDRSTVDTKIFAALLGVQHAGVTFGSMVKRSRNPLQFPIDVFKSTFDLDKGPKLDIDENLHPSLKVSAVSLEKSVHNLRKCIENILILYGISLMGHKMELARLAEVITEIYAMTAVVARASRAYCVGMRNAEDEVRVAMLFTYRTYEKVNLLVKELTEGDWCNGDMMMKAVAETTFEKKSYFASHPLERTY